MHFAPVWVKKEGPRLKSDLHFSPPPDPTLTVTPVVSGSYFKSSLVEQSNLGKKSIKTNKMKAHWASKKDLRVFYEEDTKILKTYWVP